MVVDFGSANIVGKIRQQPDKFKDVVDKILTDGLLPTVEAVNAKLDNPLPLGYCNVGRVVQIGEFVDGFNVGDLVVSNGAHSEYVLVPQNLCASLPSGVTPESASYAILSSIGLQGIRLANPSFGETFLVSGLGLIGILTSQLLVAHGCKVLAIDPDPLKCSIAEDLGINVLQLSSDSDPVNWCLLNSSGVGVDGVLITASTVSSQPVDVAAQSCRQRGRIVLVGVTGLELRRDLFYKKELTFQVSCSYGPGRYDHSYEQEGHDYPIGFVRWTEQRNFQAVLHALSTGQLRTELLTSHRFPIQQAPAAYQLLSSSEPSLGILLQYSESADLNEKSLVLSPEQHSVAFDVIPDQPCLGVIGTGNYASRVLIPSFARAGACLHTVAASSGSGPVHVGRKFGFFKATTDVQDLMRDTTCNTLVIATRHDSHASLVQQALAAGKHVFVEKPLCLTFDELCSIQAVHTGSQLLMVGFNRRFAPLLVELKHQLDSFRGPKAFVYTCNVGSIPADHWVHDPFVGGGRFIGEACHFVDLLRHLASSPIQGIKLLSTTDSKPCPDTFTVQLRFADGSIGSVHYFANGSKAFPKERLEVFFDGRVMQLDNFRKLKAWGIPSFSTRRLLSQDKGQQSCCASFLRAIESGDPAPIPVSEIFEVQQWLLDAVNN